MKQQHKCCATCNQVKQIDKFYMQGGRYMAHCKECTKVARRMDYRRSKRAAQTVIYQPQVKCCVRCEQEKDTSEFYHVYQGGKRKCRSMCKECFRSEARERWRRRHPKHNTNLSPRVRAWLVELVNSE